MSQLTFSGVSNLLSKHAENLQYQTKWMLERICNYWSNSRSKNSLIVVELREEELYLSIPQSRFECFSESRITFKDNKILSEVTFFVQHNDTKTAFHRVYVNADLIVNFCSYTREPDVDLEYANHFEEFFMNELIQAATQANFL
ncbi:hypothetical protein [Cronobacter dublinensis]|uniref:hypothetical protein n=1 Tax=Cronobacter dublinensis TaxID=413497 RepID=UPI0028945A4D|nr:hypothetical protein [Cronobacter dublinensis]MDT3606015.1 hypothetical protein [Cronobacter dublinensis]